MVLAKFYRNVDKKICRLISNKNVKAKDKVQHSYRTNGIQTGRLKFY